MTFSALVPFVFFPVVFLNVTSHFSYSDTFASQYDSDQEQWDEPLKRRFNAAQTDVTKTSSSTQTLISVPFCRDPTQPVPVLPAEEHKPTPKYASNRPAVYKKKVGHQNSYYHPPEPWVAARDDNDILEDTAPTLRKTSYSQSLYAIDNSEVNPIKELQSMARSTNNMNEDEPPFNFQAMLKRTPRNRASMKRSGETDNGIASPKKAQTPQRQREMEKSPSSVRKYAAPTPPPTKAITPTPPSKQLTRQHSRDMIISELKKRDNKPEMIYPIIDNREESEIVQLAPGITVEGTVTDL